MSAALGSVVDELVDIDASELCDGELRARFVEVRREIDRLGSYAARMLVGLHRRGLPAGEGASSTPVWVQLQTGQRFRDARVSFTAGTASESLPAVAKAWAQGEISANAAETIAQGRRTGHEDIYATMEDSLVGYAAERDHAAVDALIRRYQTRCDDLDGKAPEDKNGFSISKVGNRWASRGDHDALGGATINEAIAAATDRPAADDARTPTQRRDAALVRICRQFLDRGESPTEDGERPHITITASLESLLTGRFETTGDVVPAPAQISRLLCESKLQLIATDANGAPLDVGATVYRPSRKLRRAVRFRDRGRCRYPGCDRTHGEVHHVITFPDGTTVLANLVFLCDYHHHVLHKPGWTATFDGTTFTVTNPAGRVIGTT